MANHNQPGHIVSRRHILSGLPLLCESLALPLGAIADDEVSHSAESIHQEVVFHAPRRRIYDVLLDAKQFDQVSRLGEAMQAGTPPGAKPTQISSEVGGDFTLFGGYIFGRHLELVPSERIIQAWRVASWPAGIYSIARFAFSEQSLSASKLSFDHSGFPSGLGEHLAHGWRANYWQPLTKFLSQPQ